MEIRTRTKILFYVMFIVAFAPLRVFSQEGKSADRIEIGKIIERYYSALEAKDIGEMSTLVDANLVVLEGVNKNTGWLDYRDNHIGKEMKEWKSYSSKDRKVVISANGPSQSYAIVELDFQINLEKKTLRFHGADTFVFIKTKDRGFKIQHIHSSAKLIEAKDT